MRIIHNRHALACALVILLSPAAAIDSQAQSLTEIMFGTKPSLGSNIVALAKDYEGLHEKSDRKSLKEVTGVDPVRTPWCAAFINALLDKQNRRGSDSHAALSFLQWGVKTREPKMGDIVVMHGHVTIFITFSDDRKSFYGIGGNQANGVKVTLYPARKVISYRTYADEFVPEYLPKKKIAPKKKYTKQPVKKRRVT